MPDYLLAENADRIVQEDGFLLELDAFPKTETLVDDFESPSASALLWNITTPANIAGGQGVAPATNAYGGLESKVEYSLAGSYISADFASFADGAGSSETFLEFNVTPYDTLYSLRWGPNGSIYYKTAKAGVFDDLPLNSGNPITERKLRLLGDSNGSTLYLQTSSDGVTWTTIHTDTGLSLTRGKVRFYAGNWEGLTAPQGTARINSLNLQVAPPSPIGVGQGLGGWFSVPRRFSPGNYVDLAHPAEAVLPWDFEDNFIGTALDTTKWFKENLNYGYGSEELFIADDALYVVSNGTLKFRALRRRATGTRQWDAPFIDTHGDGGSISRFTMRTGTVEVRAKLPTNQGAWPAIWLHNKIGAPGEVHNPLAEIDLMELFPGGGNQGPGAYFTIHDWGSQPGTDLGINLPPNLGAMDGGWHTWRVTWDANQMQMWIDDVSQGVITPASFAAAKPGANYSAFVNTDQYLVLDLAVGTSWGGPIPLAGDNEIVMEVDFIRARKTS